jgi:hypothetical protein
MPEEAKVSLPGWLLPGPAARHRLGRHVLVDDQISGTEPRFVIGAKSFSGSCDIFS